MESWLIPAEPVTFVEEIKKAALSRCWRIPTAWRRRRRSSSPSARSTRMPAITVWRGSQGRQTTHSSSGFLTTVNRRVRPENRCSPQLMGSGVGEITAVVVRYYGGILLGTGGLVKAYGGGVQQALNLLITTRKTPLTEYTLLCDYAQLSGIEALLKQFNGVIAHSDYQAMVQLRVALPQAELAAFSAKLADFSRGSLQLLPIEE